MLIRARILRDAVRVHTAFVRECRGPYIRRVRPNREVADLCNIRCNARELGELIGAYALVTQLELEVGDGREQIGVSHTFAVAVDRALDLGGTSTHGGQCIGDCAPRIIMAMDADSRIRGVGDCRLHD